jgi:hypothetical protein
VEQFGNFSMTVGSVWLAIVKLALTGKKHQRKKSRRINLMSIFCGELLNRILDFLHKKKLLSFCFTSSVQARKQL